MSLHWADQAAKRLVRDKPERAPYVVASGITPSGVVHIGNLREAITSGFVAEALRSEGKDVRFVFFWDDFDVFRKVPAGLPEGFEEHLRKSLVNVPDPSGATDSYAHGLIQRFVAEFTRLGFAPEYTRQSERYQSGVYAERIATAIAQRDEIRRLLDESRTEPLPPEWFPLSGYCKACARDALSFTLEGEDLSYVCQDCGASASVDVAHDRNIKLPWRVDWPMRWAFEGVDFEPGGKDHSSAGGSFETSQKLVAKVFGGTPPQYIAYEFVLAKGATTKISSSSGNTITVSDCLEIYHPEIVRWLFARSLPSATIRLAFDEDVIQVYEEFDRAVRKARKKDGQAKRAVELSMIGSRPTMLDEAYDPPPFRQVTTVLQALDMDADKTLEHMSEGKLNDAQVFWLKERIACAGNWITKHAAPEFVYRVRSEPVKQALEGFPLQALQTLVERLRAEPDAEGVIDCLRTLSKEHKEEIGDFYTVVYQLLIDREKGPKLSTLLTSIGPARALRLLEPSLTA